MNRQVAFIFCALLALPGRAAKASAEEKPELIFEIEEGLPGDFLERNAAQPEARRQGLESALAALRPLTRDYQVSLLIYPHYFYDPAPADPARRAKAPLRELFEQCARPENREFGLWLEVYSSGIHTNQNGHAGSLPPAPLHAGEAGHQGWAMDLDALGALKKDFPATFRGVRFHEIIGSQAVWQASKQTDGFQPEEAVVRDTVALCKASGLHLLWNDSVWLMRASGRQPAYVYSRDDLPYDEAPPYRAWIDHAAAELGERATFLTANNNYHPIPSLGMWTAKVGRSQAGVPRPIPDWLYFDQPFTRFPLAGLGKSTWGLSAQSWLWHEMLNTLNGHYFLSGESMCPPQILAVQTIDALKKGAKVIEFEPSWYFFREATPETGRSFDDRAQADMGPRAALMEISNALLSHADRPHAEVATMQDLYDGDGQRLCENSEANPPRLPWSTTVVICDDTEEPQCIRVSNGVPARQVQIFDHPWWQEKFAQRGRVAIDGSGTDGFFAVTISGKEIVFFNAVGGEVCRCPVEPMIVPAATVVAGNSIRRDEGAGDSDELFILNEADPTSPQNRVYELTHQNGDRVGVVLHKIDAPAEMPFTSRNGTLTKLPVRTRKALYPDDTRTLDAPTEIPTRLTEPALAWTLADGEGMGKDGVAVLALSPQGICQLQIFSLANPSDKPLATFDLPRVPHNPSLFSLRRCIQARAVDPHL